MRVKVEISPQFEICYALADLVSARPSWNLFDTAWQALDWYKDARKFGRPFWLSLPDLLAGAPPVRTVAELVAALIEIPADVTSKRLVEGLFHSSGSDAAIPARKREWLAFIGLKVPADVKAARTALERTAARLIPAAADVIGRFAPFFETLWKTHEPALAASAERVEKLVARTRFPAIAEMLKLKVEVANPGNRLRALRGGYEIPLDEIATAYLLPSFVNTHGFWTVADFERPATAFFPFVDLEGEAGRRREPIDPWLVARALGDPTRAAIVRLLSASPQTSADLMRELDLSKATISHHIFQLRVAGVIDETPEGKAVRLALRYSTFEMLSKAFLKVLAKPNRQARSPGI